MSVCWLTLTWTFVLLPASGSSHPIARADDDAPLRPFALAPEVMPARYAILDRLPGRVPSRIGHRVCGPWPSAARPSFAEVATGLCAGPATRSGDPAGLGRNPVLRC